MTNRMMDSLRAEKELVKMAASFGCISVTKISYKIRSNDKTPSIHTRIALSSFIRRSLKEDRGFCVHCQR